MTPDTTCPLCGARAVRAADAMPGYVEGTRFGVFHCSGCHVAFATPRVTPEGLYDAIYHRAAEMPGYRRYALHAALAASASDPLEALGAVEDAYWAVGRAAMPARGASGPARVLEVGAGLGYLTYALARAGFDVRGIDISAAAVHAAAARFGPLFDCVALEAMPLDVSFDVIIACEVIEHLDDPAAFLRQALARLAPGGRLIVTTPNRSFHAADLLWETDLPPVHFWWFAERSIALLAQRLGAAVSFVDFSEYQRRSPLFLPRLLAGVPTRSPALDARLDPLARSLARTRRARIGEMIPALRSNPLLQYLRGKRRATGARREVMCAILERRD